MNTNRRTFLITSAKVAAGCTLLCGTAAVLNGCNNIEEGEPALYLNEHPELQKIGGAIKKRYRRLNNSEPILIIRLSEKEFVVYSALCTHKGVEVRLPKNGEIVCPNHGSRFRITDGTVIDGKAIEPLQKFSIELSQNKQLLTIKEL